MSMLRTVRAADLEVFCVADRNYFDHPERRPRSSDDSLHADVPATWTVSHDRDWTFYTGPDTRDRLPAQGWKIHLSARPEDAQHVLDVCAALCVSSAVSFKHLRSGHLVQAHNSKYSSRASSGKFVTIYPHDDAESAALARALDATLGSLPAPRVLSDLRVRSGPVHVRYGGFRHVECSGPDGTPVPAIARPDGVLVPDQRLPWVELPDWVTVPADLACLVHNSDDGGELGYDITEALHFSNGGGVYRGRRVADGREVVLKEARPHSAFDDAGADAVDRLSDEEAAMAALAGIPGVPPVVDRFELGGHEFVVMDHIPGLSLQQWLAANHPDLHTVATPEDHDAYFSTVTRILTDLDATLTALHARGWVFGDLHPGNVIVGDDGTTWLVDFELARPETDNRSAGLACPGFVRPDRRPGDPITRSDDRYALAAIALWAMLPLTPVLRFDPSSASRFVAHVTSRGELSALWHSVLAPLTGHPSHAKPADDTGAPISLDESPLIVADLHQHILRSGDTSRADRLYPGDVLALLGDPAQLGTGAAGVLWALDNAGLDVPDSHVAWVADRLAKCTRPGLYDGTAGIALSLLDRHRGEATDALLRAGERAVDLPDATVFSGIAGIGLALVELGDRGCAEAHDLAVRLADRSICVEDRLVPTVDTPTGQAAGYLDGWAGVSVFLARTARLTGDSGLLDRAHQVGRRDVATCDRGQDGALLVREGSILYPYLAHGSAGLALAHAELKASGRELLTDSELTGLISALSVPFVVEPGVFNGRSGLMVAVDVLRRCGALADSRAEGLLRAHSRALTLHLVRSDGGLAVPGRRLRRLAADFGTGSAGVLTQFVALEGRGHRLPLLVRGD